MKYFKFTTLLAFGLFILSSPTIPRANAEGSDSKYTVLAPLPCIPSPAQTVTGSDGTPQTIPAVVCEGEPGAVQTEVDFKTYVQYTINLLIALAAVAAVAMIVWGGIEYMTTISSQGKSEGLARVKNAIVGLLLVLSSYLIMRTIDPRFVEIPNTLVPKLNINKTLYLDPSEALILKLQNDASQYRLTSAQIAALLVKAKKDIQAKQAELDVVESKLKSATAEPDDPQYMALQVEKAKINDELNGLNVTYQTELARSAMNGVLGDAISAASNTQNNAKDVLVQLNNYIKILNQNVTIYKDRLTKLQQSDTSNIYQLAYYDNAVINLMKIDTIVADAKILQGQSGGNWSGVHAPEMVVQMQKIDGSGLDDPQQNPAAAKAKLQAEIDKVNTSLAKISDANLIAELETKLDRTKSALEAKFSK